jgi:Heterokaryon incompatibility protein (HET)
VGWYFSTTSDEIKPRSTIPRRRPSKFQNGDTSSYQGRGSSCMQHWRGIPLGRFSLHYTDDESIKHHLISQMGSIYNNAIVTIVATSAKNATYGLPGVGKNSRSIENLVEIPGTGLRITDRSELETIIENSTYNTRGWTFQERLLSRRCLSFTEKQIFSNVGDVFIRKTS